MSYWHYTDEKENADLYLEKNLKIFKFRIGSPWKFTSKLVKLITQTGYEGLHLCPRKRYF